MRIAVFGSAVSENIDTDRLARQVGEAIAEHHAEILTGGCGGLPGQAAEAALGQGGKMTAYSPGRDLQEHQKFGLPTFNCSWEFVSDDFPFVGNRSACMKYRNVITCANADACIIIGGRIGTLNEFTIAYDLGKVIGVLDKSGGSAGHIREIIEMAGKDTGAVVVYDEDPENLVEMVIQEAQSA